jgi:lipoyl(octanoyl) transferase
MGTCRVVIEPEPQSGVRNMAIDEALLEAAIERGECTVRWYRWQTATVSLGYFQETAEVHAIPELSTLPLVRRLTGGGAILHHYEWTYSCTVPANHALSKTPGRIYDLVHEKIVALLSIQGISAQLRGGATGRRETPFLCFGRTDPHDVVLNGQKIVGSAQRRRRGAVLQHGSVLLRRSEYAPQFPGLLDLLSGEVIDPRRVPGVERREPPVSEPPTSWGERKPFDPRQATAFDEQFVKSAGEAIGSLFGSINVVAEHTEWIEERAANLDARYQAVDWRRHREH